uniref:Uncharacterized protein n=1 Tax=Varanus komodoensis TaxID=61221 RepID=A0A8D2LV16_VARKO
MHHTVTRGVCGGRGQCGFPGDLLDQIHPSSPRVSFYSSCLLAYIVKIRVGRTSFGIHLPGTGVSNPRPAGWMRPRSAMNVAQPKIINLLKTLRYFSDFLVTRLHSSQA